VYQSYFAPPPITTPSSTPAGDPVPPSTSTVPAPPSPAPVEKAAPPAGAAPLVADAEARDIVVETPAVRAVFTTRGGALKSWQLKEYLQNGQPLDRPMTRRSRRCSPRRSSSRAPRR
jgi:YidC/Oxa1 family membrane protein insertase